MVNLKVDDFLNLYKSKNIKEISKELGVTIIELADWMKENSIKLHKEDIAIVNHERQVIHIDKDELYQKFIVENMTRKQVADYFGVSEALIKKKCRLYGIKKGPEKYIKNTDKTLLKRYGTTNVRVLAADKIAKTNLKKYGVKAPFQSIKIQKKVFKRKKPSKPEEKVMNILDKINVQYEREYFVEGYKDRLFLAFDFAVFDENKNIKGFIEVDGIFHNATFFGEEEAKRKKLADEYKNSYCNEKKIPLLRLSDENTFENKINKFIDEIM